MRQNAAPDTDDITQFVVDPKINGHINLQQNQGMTELVPDVFRQSNVVAVMLIQRTRGHPFLQWLGKQQKTCSFAAESDKGALWFWGQLNGMRDQMMSPPFQSFEKVQ